MIVSPLSIPATILLLGTSYLMLVRLLLSLMGRSGSRKTI